MAKRIKVGVTTAQTAEATPQNDGGNGGAPFVNLFPDAAPSGNDLLNSLLGGMSVDLNSGNPTDLLGAIKPVTEKQIVAEIHKQTGPGTSPVGLGPDLSALVAENVKTRTEVLAAINGLREIVTNAFATQREALSAMHTAEANQQNALKSLLQTVGGIQSTLTALVNSLTKDDDTPTAEPGKVIHTEKPAVEKTQGPAVDPQLAAFLKNAMAQLQARTGGNGGTVPAIPLALKLQYGAPHLTAEQVLCGMRDLGWKIDGENVVIPPTTK